MPILFKQRFVPLILNGTKTQTRRLWPAGVHVKQGGEYQCRTTLFGPPFARMRITKLRSQRLLAITDAEARAEGFATAEEFLTAFRSINRHDSTYNPLVWVVEFEVLGVPDAVARSL